MVARALAKARLRPEPHVSNALTRASFLSIHSRARIRMHTLPVRTPDLGERWCVGITRGLAWLVRCEIYRTDDWLRDRILLEIVLLRRGPWVEMKSSCCHGEVKIILQTLPSLRSRFLGTHASDSSLAVLDVFFFFFFFWIIIFAAELTLGFLRIR